MTLSVTSKNSTFTFGFRP